MKYRVLPIAVALGLASATSALADSPALQRAEKAAAKVDLTEFFTSRTDARSQSLGFGGTHEHAVTVTRPGRYAFISDTLAGESDDYRIEATLLDARGNVVASQEAWGNDGGLRLVEYLEPGEYILRVFANKYGTEATGGNSYIIKMVGLDDSGQQLSSEASGIDAGSAIRFGKSETDGRTTAFVGKGDGVAAIAPPSSDAVEEVDARSAPDSPADIEVKDPAKVLSVQRQTAVAVPPPETSPDGEAADVQPRTPKRESEQTPEAFDEIVMDVDIRTKDEVLTFDVLEAGTVSVTSSTFVGSEAQYRLEARILDASGNVVASDEAKGFEGDFDIETRLDPGRYRVWVNGQKFGSASSGANNYTLRVQQLNTR
jgi:hypothetical protein